MVRRLSITVPDELWDELTHLDPSPSALVQRALRCLSDTEGPGASPTQLEVAAAELPHWQSVLDNLTNEAMTRRAAGYELMINGLNADDLDLRALELISQGYPADQLPGFLMLAVRHFLYVREIGRDRIEKQFQRGEITDDERFEWQTSKLRSTDFLFGDCDGFDHAIGMGWDSDEVEILEYLYSLFIGRISSNSLSGHWLSDLENGVHNFDPSRLPGTDITLSFFEGMAAAILDIIGTVRRRVRAESKPGIFALGEQ